MKSSYSKGRLTKGDKRMLLNMLDDYGDMLEEKGRPSLTNVERKIIKKLKD
jgi:replication-associated recombination protein RarA